MSTEQINQATKYFETINKEIIKCSTKEEPLQLNLIDLAKYNPKLTELILDDYENGLETLKIGLEQHCTSNEEKTPELLLQNPPQECRILIGNIRAQHMNKLLFTEGKIKHKSDVRPKVTMTRYECPSCGNVITIIQLDEKLKEPTKCSCGRTGKFRMLHKEFTDIQILSIQENFRDLKAGERPRDIKILLKGKSLTSPIKERRYMPGNTIRAIGVIKTTPQYLRSGKQKTTYDIMFEANNIIHLEQEIGDIEITKEEIKKIKETSKNPNLYQKLMESMAPGILGCETAKKAILLFLFNGPTFPEGKTEKIRGTFNVALIGDPATSKSKLLNFVHKIHPRSGLAQGPGLTGPGLTANMTKDEHFGWILEGGLLSIYNGGCLCIDEFEKADDTAKNSLHGPAEDQVVIIDKANIHTSLPAITPLLITANPKQGSFDRYNAAPAAIRGEIDLPDTLFSRFDLIIPFFDRASEHDKEVADFILRKFEIANKPDLHKELMNEDNPFSDVDFLRKYILYAIRNSNPIITKKKCAELSQFFYQVRRMSEEKTTITFRQMEALIRLSCAHAKIRLAKYVTEKDTKFVIELYKDMLLLFGSDIDAGEAPDMQAIFEPGLTWNAKEQRKVIIQILKTAVELNGTSTLIKSLLIDVLLDKEIFCSEEDIEDFLQKLRETGDLFIPKTIEIEGNTEELIGLM